MRTKPPAEKSNESKQSYRLTKSQGERRNGTRQKKTELEPNALACVHTLIKELNAKKCNEWVVGEAG